MDLVQEVARVALQMFEVHLAGTPQMRLQDDIHMHPYSHLMAIMIVAIKLVYGLDAEDAQASHSSTHQALEWQSWADAVVGSSRGPTTFPKTALEVQPPKRQVLHLSACMLVKWLASCEMCVHASAERARQLTEWDSDGCRRRC